MVIGIPVMAGSIVGSCGVLGGTGLRLKPGGHSKVKGGGQIMVGRVVSSILMVCVHWTVLNPKSITEI